VSATIDVRRYSHFVEGSEVAVSAETIERRNPASGELVAQFAAGDPADMVAAIDSARRAFDSGGWPQLSGTDRADVLLAFADGVKAESDRLARIEVEEAGKPLRLAQDELTGVVTLTRIAAGLAQQLHGDVHTNLGTAYTGMVLREPVGVVGAIVPWNWASGIFAQKVPYALAAGCTVVVKPSEYTSGTALEMASLAYEAGVPAGVLNVVTGYGAVVGQTLLDSPDVDMISFTGSTATGLRVLDAQKTNWKRVALELGGKSANIVLDDADQDAALDGALKAVFFNSGQACCAGTRLLVQDSIADEFLARLVARAEALRAGDLFDLSTDLGSLIHESHTDQVMGRIEEGIEAGARLLTGGTRRGPCAVDPTIFDDVTSDMAIFQEEIFGPVLSVTRVRNAEHAVELANDTQYGLAASLWTKDVDKALLMSRRLRSGTVWVNSTIDSPPQLPFGGAKASGYGREMGAAGLEEFTEVKTVSIHHGEHTPYFSA
jgi:betaine-aldehyde dehydrogenase